MGGYIIAKTLEDAKKIARRENKNMPENVKKHNSYKITSGKLHKQHATFNEYAFETKYYV